MTRTPPTAPNCLHTAISAAAIAAIALLAAAPAAHAATFTWTSGAFVPGTTAPSPLAAADTLSIEGTAGKNFNAVTFVNNGTVAWLASAGNVSAINGAALTNNGLWEFQGNQSLPTSGSFGASFVNNGTLRKRIGTGDTTIGVSADGVGQLQFTHNGVIDVQSGALRLLGQNTLAAGATFTGNGIVELGGTSTVNGAFDIANLRFASVSTHAGNAAVINGQASWSAGTLTGSWGNTATSTWTLNTGGATLNAAVDGAGSVFTNRGNLLVTATTAGLGVRNGATFVNDGLFDMQGNASHSASGGGTFVNNGTLRKSAGSFSTFGSAVGVFEIVNNGTIDARVGTIQFDDLLDNGGTLMGNGTVLAAGIVNQARIAPGDDGAAGTLTLSGSFSQAASGTLQLDLGTLASHDQLDVTGTALLGGTLALNCLGACSYAVGDTFTIVDSTGNLNGSFASVTLSGFATGAFSVVYDNAADLVRLQVTQAVTAAVPEPQGWALLLAGLGCLGWWGQRAQRG